MDPIIEVNAPAAGAKWAGATGEEAVLLTDRLHRLAALRGKQGAAKATLTQARKAWEEANATTIAALAEADKEIEAIERQIKDGALFLYQQQGTQRPVPGVEVKLFTVAEVDEVKGLEWAKQSRLALLPERLDVKALEKIAKATPLPDGVVTMREEPRAQISTKLGEVLDFTLGSTPIVASPAMPPEGVALMADPLDITSPDKFAEGLAANRIAFAKMKAELAAPLDIFPER